MKIVNDLHLGSTYESMSYADACLLMDPAVPTTWIGDIVDMRNCKKSEVELWESRLHSMRQAAIMCGHGWIGGNHELNIEVTPEWLVIDGVYYCHGDLGLLWPRAKGLEFRARSPGASWFKRHLLSPLINEARELVDAKIDQRFLDEVVRLSDTYHVHTVVAGHKHPNKRIDGTYHGVRYSVLPRGVNEL